MRRFCISSCENCCMIIETGVGDTTKGRRLSESLTALDLNRKKSKSKDAGSSVCLPMAGESSSHPDFPGSTDKLILLKGEALHLHGTGTCTSLQCRVQTASFSPLKTKHRKSCSLCGIHSNKYTFSSAWQGILSGLALGEMTNFAASSLYIPIMGLTSLVLQRKARGHGGAGSVQLSPGGHDVPCVCVLQFLIGGAGCTQQLCTLCNSMLLVPP